ALITCAILAAGCTGPGTIPLPAATAPEIPMKVPVEPIPVRSSEGMNLAYELEFHPPGNLTVLPEKVEVIDKATGRVLETIDGDHLELLWHPATYPPPTQEEIDTFTSKLPHPRLSVWLVVSPSEVPDRLVHRVTLNRNAEGLPPVTLLGGEVAVRKDLKPVVIASPVRGPGWLIIETTWPFTHHFRAQITTKGGTRVPQRYAQDLIGADPRTGRLASDNMTEIRSWYGYGSELYAVADATVADTLDGLPDIPTIYSTPPATITTACGNYVILDLGNDKYACYGHMIPGSITVKKGDRVTEGQVIGLVGNSGNSDVPHLHFQVVNGTPSFLGAEGYPHVYRSFDAIGRGDQEQIDEKTSVDDFSGILFWEEYPDFMTRYETPLQRQMMLPDNHNLVRLP
ncbi:MAG: M23 family metallopeptidase, partial [Methanoregula sp.]|nr:M23 family metallopeptidase [Methanoregula sp.]